MSKDFGVKDEFFYMGGIDLLEFEALYEKFPFRGIYNFSINLMIKIESLNNLTIFIYIFYSNESIF